VVVVVVVEAVVVLEVVVVVVLVNIEDVVEVSVTFDDVAFVKEIDVVT
jgi:hypothetical protein